MTTVAIDPDELEAWNAAQLRARAAYAAGTRHVERSTCTCGNRTWHPSGICKSCRDNPTPGGTA